MSLRAGLAVLHTQAAGDCGIDAMSYYTALPRTASSFKAVRKSLADFMVSVAAKPSGNEYSERAKNMTRLMENM